MRAVRGLINAPSGAGSEPYFHGHLAKPGQLDANC